MPKCVYIQDSKCASGPKYAKFWILQSSQYDRILNCQAMPWHSFEYLAAPVLVSEYARILKMAGFWICKSYTGFYIYHNTTKYVWIRREYASMFEFKIKGSVLNVYRTVHIANSLYKLMSTYWEMGIFRTQI